MKRCTATKIPQILQRNLHNLQIQYDLLSEVDLCSNCGHICNKTVSFDKMVCTSLMKRRAWVTSILIAVLLTTLKFLHRSKRSTENGKTIADLAKNPSASQITISITVALLRSIPLECFWTRRFFGTWIQQPIWHSTTLLVRTLKSTSILKKTTHQLRKYFIRCFIQCDHWTVKRRDCASTVHSFETNSKRTDKWTKQLLWLKNWVIFGNPEQWLEIHYLWWPVVVFVWLSDFDFY